MNKNIRVLLYLWRKIIHVENDQDDHPPRQRHARRRATVPRARLWSARCRVRCANRDACKFRGDGRARALGVRAARRQSERFVRATGRRVRIAFRLAKPDSQSARDVRVLARCASRVRAPGGQRGARRARIGRADPGIANLVGHTYIARIADSVRAMFASADHADARFSISAFAVHIFTRRDVQSFDASRRGDASIV